MLWIVGAAAGLLLVTGALSYLTAVLVAQSWPHDTSRHVGWEDR